MKKTFLSVTVLLFFVQSVLGRQSEIDSLKLVFETNPTDSEKIPLLNRLTFLLRETDIQQALEYGIEAENMALTLNDSIGLGRAKGNIGWIYYRMGKWENAFRYSKDAYQIGIQQGDQYEVSMVLNNLGALYYQQKNYPEAIKKFKEAFTIGEGLDDPYVMIRSLNNMALNFVRLGELDSALYFAQEALDRNEKEGLFFFTSFTNRVIGDVQLEKGQLAQAIATFENALVMASHHRLRSFEASILHRLGKAYYLMGDYNRANQYLERGLVLAQTNGFRDELVNTYKNLSMVHEKSGNVAKAFQFLQDYVELSEVLDQESDMDRFALIQGMFEVEKADAELRTFKSESELNAIKLQSAERIVLIISVTSVVFVLLMVWLVYLNRKTKAMNAKLIAEQKKVNSQKQELERRSIELQASNKTKNQLFSILGHDLRSPVAQLQGVLDLLQNNELTKQEFDSISSTLKRNVDGLFINLDNILSWSRSQLEGFILDLKPVNISKVIPICMELFSHPIEVKELKIESRIDPGFQVIADRDLLQIVIRNLMSNAIKFSKKGGNIIISQTIVKGWSHISIQDNGVGMTADQIKQINGFQTSLMVSSVGTEKEKGTGLGLGICKEFVNMMQGKFKLKSEKDKGTIATISLPIGEIN